MIAREISFKQMPEGSYPARCYAIIDMGTADDIYGGHKRQLMIKFEFPTLPLKDYGKGEGLEPQGISDFYTLSLHEDSKLRQHLEMWRTKDFTREELKDGYDLKKILGVPCIVSVKHNEKGKAKINKIFKYDLTDELPPPMRKIVYFDFDEYEQPVYDSLSDGTKKLIMKSDEYLAMQGIQESPSTEKSFADEMREDNSDPFA